MLDGRCRRLARLISGGKHMDGVLLQAVLNENLQDEKFRIPAKLLDEFVGRVVQTTHEILVRHLA